MLCPVKVCVAPGCTSQCLLHNNQPKTILRAYKNKCLLLSHQSACLPGHLCFRSVPQVSEAQDGMAELARTCSSHSENQKFPQEQVEISYAS